MLHYRKKIFLGNAQFKTLLKFSKLSLTISLIENNF